MPTSIASPFLDRQGRSGTHPRAKYPWDDWFDGEVHVLYRGEDYHVAPHHFQDRVHHESYRRNIAISTRRLGDVVLVQSGGPLP